MSDSYVSKVDSIAGEHRPQKPGQDRMDEMYAGLGMKAPKQPGCYHGPGQRTTYTVPVKRVGHDTKNGK